MKQYANRIPLSFCTVLIILIVSSLDVAAQGSVQNQVAALNQRFQALERKYGLLELEIENLKAENQRLRKTIATLKQDDPAAGIDEKIDQAVDEKLTAVEGNIQKQYEKLQVTIMRKLDTVNTASTRVSTPSTPTQTRPTIQRTDNFPKTGIPYVVKSGDTLSGIAAKHGSTIQYIISANKEIADPNNVRVGQKLFIPIRQ